MTDIATYLIILAIFAGVTMAALNWSQNRAIRIISIVSLVLSLGSGAFLTVQAKGTPLPVAMTYALPSGPYDVISYVLRENEAIYVWISDASGHPVYLALPWSVKDAQEMVESDKEAEKEGGTKKICLGDPAACPSGEGEGGGQQDGQSGGAPGQAGDGGADGDGAAKVFWASPPGALPPKTGG